MTDPANPLGLNGFEFVEFTSPDPEAMGKQFEMLGFVPTHRHPSKNVTRYKQGRINLMLNRDEAGRVTDEHKQALTAREAEHRERLSREEQRHESTETRLMALLDQARQERLAQEKAAASREEQLEKRLGRLEAQLQEARARQAEEEKRHRETDWARRQAEALADTRHHEHALLQARIDEQKRHLEDQAQRVRNLEEQLHRCLWQKPAAAREEEEDDAKPDIENENENETPDGGS